MYVKRTYSRYFLITSNRLDSFDEKHGRRTSPTLLIFQLHENRVRREETGTLLSSPRQTDKSFIATRQKNFLPLAPVVPSIGLIIESRCRRCNGFPGRTSDRDVLANQDKKKPSCREFPCLPVPGE